MKMLLRPVDTFFFRNHKSLYPGTDYFASGFFPPRPGTVYGALRSAFIHANSDFAVYASGANQSLVQVMGTPASYGDFQMKAVFWQDAQDLVVPLPLDHQVWREEKNARASRLALCCDHQAKAWGSDQSEYRLYGKWKMKSAGAVGYYIYKRSLEQSLLGETDLTVMPLEKWLVRESKTGIAHDWKTNQAKEGMLYSLDLFRFRESSETAIAVFANDSADFSNVPLVSLGAKQRPWSLEVVQEDLTFAVTAEELIASIEETRVARIILLTPAVWRYGARPECFEPVTNSLLIGDQSYPLLAAALGRPFVVGGWDLVFHRPKARYNAVPAGSVLYVQVPQGGARNLVNSLHGRSFSDEMSQEGYGFTVVGCGRAED